MKTDHIIPHKRLPTTTLERLPVLFSPSLSLSLSSYYHLSLTLTYFTLKHITEYMNRKYDLPVEWVFQPSGLLAHSSQLPLCKHLSLWGWQTSGHLLTGKRSCLSSPWPHGSRWWRWGWPSPGGAAAGLSAHPSTESSCRQEPTLSVHWWNPFNKGELLCFFRRCQLLVQGAGQGVPTKCPKILTCLFYCKLRQGGLSGNPRAFNKTRWSLLTTLARLMYLPSVFLILQMGEGVGGKQERDWNVSVAIPKVPTDKGIFQPAYNFR